MRVGPRHQGGVVGGGDVGSVDSQMFCHPNSVHARAREWTDTLVKHNVRTTTTATTNNHKQPQTTTTTTTTIILLSTTLSLAVIAWASGVAFENGNGFFGRLGFGMGSILGSTVATSSAQYSACFKNFT